MVDSLQPNDIVQTFQDKIYTQSYPGNTQITGVKLITLTNHVAEDGDFCEIMRLETGNTVANLPEFTLAQINRSKIQPGCIKAWHLHYAQDEIWYVPPSGQLFVGLWDLRQNSQSSQLTMRLSLGGGQSQLLYIPRGVAHGYANSLQNPTDLYYFVSNNFNPQNPDERRLHWDALGKDFWEPQRD